MDSHDDIIKFINTFKAKYKNEIEYIFMNGQCYWFSFILKERFKGEIYYVPVYIHFITKINDRYYDITGEVTNVEILDLSILWDEYQRNEPLDSERISYYCINKAE